MKRRSALVRSAAPIACLVVATCTLPTDVQEGRLRPSFFEASSSAVTLVGAGDIATCTNEGDHATAEVVENVLASSPNVTVFTTGDNAYPNGSAADYQNCYHPTWGEFKSKTRPALGNHEYNTGSANPTFDYYNGPGTTTGPAGKRGEGWYSYDVGKWHIVVLNVNSAFVGTRTGSAQESWLQADLAATAQPCVLAYWHHPRFYSGTTSPLPAPSAYHLDFWKDLYAAGADLVLNGHAHVYERYAPQTPDGVLDMTKGLRQITVGTGGASGGSLTVLRENVEVVEGRTLGALKLTLDDGRYAWEFLPVAGKTFTDRGTGICHGSPEPTGNTAPQVSFTPHCDGLSCSLTDNSVDVGGRVVEWGWSFGDGSTSVKRNPTHSYAAAGSYTVRLTAADDDGVMRSLSKQVVVGGSPAGGPPNAPPSVSFTQSCSGLTCTFTDASTDSDGSIAAWSWSFGDGGSSSARNPTRTFPAAGIYTVTLVADDDDGASGTSSAPVTVSGTAPPITLNVSTRFDATTQYMTLDWTGAKGDSVDVFRNDVKITVQLNDGHYGNSRNFTGPATYVYRVCQLRSTICSNTATAVFGSPSNAPPTASFTASCTSLTCTFTDASTDADGTIKAWNWSFGDDGGSASVRNPTYSYALEDKYTVTLIVTDDRGATGTTTRQVTATPPPTNSPPVAAFTVRCTDRSCQFTDGSSDADGTLTGRHWNFGDNTSSTETSPLHVYQADGTFTVTLTVTDNAGDTGAASQQLTFTPPGPNSPPTAGFTVSCKGFTCTFTDASTDSDGQVTGWSWDFGDSGTSTDRNPSHIYTSEGTKTVTLISTDNRGGTGTITKQITVTPPSPNVPPVADFSSACADLVCTFTDASTDPDGGQVTGWSWDFGDGGSSIAQNPSHEYGGPATYDVVLISTDNDGGKDTVTHQVSVTAPPPPPPNTPPLAGFSPNCTNLTCTFTDASTDPDGSIAAWSWKFGDGSSSTLQSPSRTYAAAGTYTVSLDVTDNAGGHGTSSSSMTVALPPNVLPTANFSSNCTNLACTFTDASTDPDGTVTAWKWTFGDGGSSTTKSPSHTYAAASSYSVTLVATDNRGGTGQRAATVSVTKPPAIVLTASGRTQTGQQLMTLDWTGAKGATVSVYRNGALLINTPNDGHYVNSRNFVGPATYVYKVCELGTTVCSNQVTVVFK
jgi:PKD repeat protein